MQPPQTTLEPALKVLTTGLGASLQDLGRPGFGRFGVPRSGAMDAHAATWANRLLDNPPHAATLELLLQGASLLALKTCWISVCGADQSCSLPTWKTVRLERGSVVEFPRNRTGLWTYLAIEGGFADPENAHFGSVSGDQAAGLGTRILPDQDLRHHAAHALRLPTGVAARMAPWDERRDYRYPPRLRAWKGPQWDRFSCAEQERFFSNPWMVSSRSDRTGYRIQGGPQETSAALTLSEAVIPGSVQVPPDGQPIITMNDGPTVGGYPKIALLHPDDLAWLAQSRPGLAVRFELLA